MQKEIAAHMSITTEAVKEIINRHLPGADEKQLAEIFRGFQVSWEKDSAF